MWSVGCIFAELMQKQPLFPGRGEIDQIGLVSKDRGLPCVVCRLSWIHGISMSADIQAAGKTERTDMAGLQQITIDQDDQCHWSTVRTGYIGHPV